MLTRAWRALHLQASPLVAGNDLRVMSKETAAILTNRYATTMF